MQTTNFCEVQFSINHRCYFDLRFRKIEVDNGYLHQDKQGIKVINLPSGEVYFAPYEGEHGGEPNKIEGELPIFNEENNEIIIFVVRENRIIEIKGKSEVAELLREFFNRDPARQNIAKALL